MPVYGYWGFQSGWWNQTSSFEPSWMSPDPSRLMLDLARTVPPLPSSPALDDKGWLRYCIKFHFGKQSVNRQLIIWLFDVSPPSLFLARPLLHVLYLVHRTVPYLGDEKIPSPWLVEIWLIYFFRTPYGKIGCKICAMKIGLWVKIVDHHYCP